MRTRQVSVVHSHPPSHNIRNIISMTLVEIQRQTLFLYTWKGITWLSLQQPALPIYPFKAFRCGEFRTNPTEPHHVCFPIMKTEDWWVQHPTFMLDWFLATHLLPRRLKSATLNFWIMEGVQKVTFSIHNLYSQMHFRSRMCPEGHWKGFEGCPKRRFELRTRARNSSVFQTKIKDLYDNLQKIIGWDPAAIQKVKGIESKTSSC